jgi:carboxypeptidase Taq
MGVLKKNPSILHPMDLYEEFLKRVQDIHRMQALQGHLGWDQEVLMPSKGAASRGEMMAWLAGQRHQLLTDGPHGRTVGCAGKSKP